MKLRNVGSSGLKVSRLGLGTMTWGRDTDPDTAMTLLRRYCEAGGNLLDTAPAYGNGAAEQIIGRALRHGADRDDLVIMSKAGFGIHDGKTVLDTSRSALLTDLRGSLSRMGTDYLDVWQLHAWGEAPLEESLSAIDQAVSSGMVRYAGISNFVGWQTAQAVTWQRAVPGRAPIISTEVEYSLLARRAEVEVLPAVDAYGMGFFPWSPLGRGVLTGKYRKAVPRDSRGAQDHFSWFVEPYLELRSRAVVEAVVRASIGLELDPAVVSLLWVRDAPLVTAPILGARTPTQLALLLAAENIELPEEIARALDDVSGGKNLLRS